MVYWCSLLLLSLSLALPLQATEKKALLIGVNDYLNGPPDWDLRGCENDVLMTRELLITKFGFPAENIRTLLNGQATAQGIQQAIEEWLIRGTSPDDIVYFHFSGHGSQTKDWDGDEEDGEDELICPVDLEQGRLNTVITDDQLKDLLSRIPARNLTVVLDACHSGTGTRDLSLSRPRFIEFEPGEQTRSLGVSTAARPASVPVAGGKLSGSGGMESEGKQQVTISGCKPDQTSADAWIREGFYAGALTYYLIENMKKAPPEITYRELMERVVRDMAGTYRQIPQIEGNADRLLFGTPVSEVVAIPFLEVQAVEGRQMILKAGQNQGVTRGSIYAIYPPGESTFAGPTLGRAKVTRVELGTTEALALDKVPIMAGCRAREILHNPGIGKLEILVEGGDEQIRSALIQALGQIQFVDVVQEGQHFDHRLKIVPSPAGWQVFLTFDGNPGPPVEGKGATFLVEALRSQLENIYTVHFLSALDNPEPPFKVEIWANRATPGNPNLVAEALETAPDEKLVQAWVGDVIRFNFRAEKDCYLTLVNVGTSGKVTVLFPNQYRPDGFIQGGRIYQTETRGEMPFKIRVTGPAGRELVKVIATLEPLKLSSLELGKAGGKGIRTIESGSDFARKMAFDLAVEKPAAESDILLLPVDKWATDYLIIETRP